jgi:hypothetical protein
MWINQYDRVRLKDGRTATVVEVFGDNEWFIVDVDLDGDWETIGAFKNEIQEVLRINTAPKRRYR